MFALAAVAAVDVPALEIEGTPKVEATGQKGSDGSPELKITVNLKQPVPAGFTKGKLDVFTDRSWPQGSPFDIAPGAKSITVKGWFHHSLEYPYEFARIKVNNPATSQTIEIKFDVDIPGDF
jgi:hypothetical protein